MLLCLAIFGSVSQENDLVALDLVAQCILYWRQHIPMRRQLTITRCHDGYSRGYF